MSDQFLHYDHKTPFFFIYLRFNVLFQSISVIYQHVGLVNVLLLRDHISLVFGGGFFGEGGIYQLSVSSLIYKLVVCIIIT